MLPISVRLLPYETVAEKWASAGEIILWLPIAAVILSAIILGINSIRLDKQASSTLRVLFVFVSTVIVTTGVQYFLAIVS